MSVRFTKKLNDGSIVYIRPITGHDVERERRFVDGLSKQSKYFRFLGAIRHLTADELRRFCDVDREHEMAFVALVRNGAQEIQVGIARYVADPDKSEAEIAVTIADAWQFKGLDEILLKHLFDYAENCDIERLYSIEPAANTGTQDLARKFNFESAADPKDATQVINRLNLVINA